MASEAAPDNIGLGRPNEIQYILNGATCGSLKKKQTAREWLDKFGIPVEDEFFIKWNETVFKLITTMQRYEGKGGITNRTLEMLWSAIYQSLYIDYDIHQEFYPQFEVNVTKILGTLDKLEHLS